MAREGRRYRAMAFSAGLISVFLITGCVGYWVVTRHFKDNPIDNSIEESGGASIVDVRASLLKAFPPGSPLRDVRRKLEDMGAKCATDAEKDGKIVCRYTQWRANELRHPFGRSPHSREDFRFRIELIADRGRLRDFVVCLGETSVLYEGGRIIKKDEIPMSCKDPLDPRGR